MTEAQAERTRLFARALGPFLVLLAAAMFTRYETLPVVLPTFVQNGPLILVAGVFTLLAGCFMFAAHHHFNSAAAIAVSVLAIIFIVRGASLAITPDLVMGLATKVSRMQLVLLAATTCFLLLGAWLTFVGWFGRKTA